MTECLIFGIPAETVLTARPLFAAADCNVLVSYGNRTENTEEWPKTVSPAVSWRRQ